MEWDGGEGEEYGDGWYGVAGKWGIGASNKRGGSV